MKILKLFIPLIIIAVIFQACRENDLLETYMLEADQSHLEWKGYTNSYSHICTLGVEANDIKVKHGRILSGTLIMPISTLKNLDHQDERHPFIIDYPNSPQMLADHPVIIFKIREVTLLSGIHPTAVPGANWWMRGDMTMWGQIHQISFPAKIKYIGNDMEVEAKFNLDRTYWGMKFGTNPSLEANEMHPIVDLHLKGRGRINNRLII